MAKSRLKSNCEVDWHIARTIAASTFNAMDSEPVALQKCVGRVLAEDAIALTQLPSFTSSAMDGYAVNGIGPWLVVGDVKAGQASQGILEVSQAVRIATGAIPPVGTEFIIRWENSLTLEESKISISDPSLLEIGKDFRPAGAECKVGEILVPTSTVLNPGQIGLLAATGYDYLSVHKRPSVAVIAFGDELQHKGVPDFGMVRDCLTVQLPAWIEKLHGELVSTIFVSDQIELVREAISNAIENFDVVITTGGTADGPRDFLRPVLNEIGATIIVDRVRVRPGHPMMLASADNAQGRKVPIIALPGNPLSAIVGILTLAVPVLSSLVGIKLEELTKISINQSFSVPDRFTRLIPGKLIKNEFIASDYLGSAMLRGLANSDGFGVVNQELILAGQDIQWLGLP